MQPYILIICLFFTTFSQAANSDQDQHDELHNEIAEHYVKLVLALGEHDSHYVDAYYGPEAWQKEVRQQALSLTEIIDQAERLLTPLSREIYYQDKMTRLRVHFLKTQLNALLAKAQMLKGEIVPDFITQAKLLYDTTPPRNDLTSFDTILDQVEQLLPGGGSLLKRVNTFREQFAIPKDKLEAVFNASINECRRRTKAHIPLLDNENFRIEYVHDKAWSAYNWYKGNAFSLIQVNQDFPIYISRAIDLGCHEGYPGHHVFNALLEENLVKKRGWAEYSVYPLYSPQSLLAEGSANYGIELAFPEQEKLQFEQIVLFPLAGLNPKLAPKYHEFTQLTQQLKYAGNEVARLYIDGKISRKIAIKWLAKYDIQSLEKSEQRVRFIEAYGAYVINYNWGKDLVKNYIEQEQKITTKQKWQRFYELLSTPRVPSSLTIESSN